MFCLSNFREFGGSGVWSASATSLLGENCPQMLSKRRKDIGRIHWVCKNPPAAQWEACSGLRREVGSWDWSYQALIFIIVFSLFQAL